MTALDELICLDFSSAEVVDRRAVSGASATVYRFSDIPVDYVAMRLEQEMYSGNDISDAVVFVAMKGSCEFVLIDRLGERVSIIAEGENIFIPRGTRYQVKPADGFTACELMGAYAPRHDLDINTVFR